MSFSPITKLAYLPGQEGSFTFSPTDAATWQFKPGGLNTGIVGFDGPFNHLVGGGGGPRLSPHEPEGADKQPQASGGFLVA